MSDAHTTSAPSHPFIESSRVEGTAVYDANGKQIGVIKRLVIEKVNGNVAYAVTSFRKFIGGSSDSHTIPWNYLHYDLGLQGYRTNITEEQLHNAPEFSRRDDHLISGQEWELLAEYYAGPL